MHAALLEPPPPLTPFEQAAGRPMVYHVPEGQGHSPAQSSITALSTLFRTLIQHATTVPGTRMGYWSAWRGFLTFLFLHNALAQALPASVDVLQAYFMQLIICGYSGVAIEKFMTAIRSRHHQYGFSLSLPPRILGDWTTAIDNQLGMPKKEKMLMLACQLRAILRLP